MKRRWFPLVVLAGVVLMGCGGIEEVPAQQSLATVESALVTCTATCGDGSTLSCTGETCTASDNFHVTCDGVRQDCPTPPTECTTRRSCEATNGRSCYEPRARLDCCTAEETPGICVCGASRWACIF
ncbi:hypothetical protein [Hyalangium gracile]|uniref:hypothetical protein n=1 Tax=Hyalangium gracile TaxID=394092 RepID=UPI001CCADE4B|nr:hypothetical protein [Hyalangium gracile]